MTITRINEENAEGFYRFAPGENLLPKTLKQRMVFGVLTGDDGKGEPAGLLIFDLTFGGYEDILPFQVLELLWIYVDEGKRGQGYGRALIEQLFTIADAARMSSVRCSYLSDFELEDLKSFLQHFGFTFSKAERVELYTSLEAFMESGKLEKKAGDKDVLSLEEFSESQAGRAFELLGFDADTLSGDEKLHYEPDLSSAIMQKNKVTGLFLVGSRDEDDGRSQLEPIIFRVLPGVSSDSTYALLQHTFNRITEFYGPQTRIYIGTNSPAAVKLIKYLAPDTPLLEIECGDRKC